jgi:hypothetical protein
VTQVAEQLGAKVAGFTVLGLLLVGGAAWGGIYLHVGDKAPRDARVEAIGSTGFSVNVFRTFHPLGSGKVLRKEKFHTDYIAADTVRCGAPPKPTPEKKPKPKPRHG